MEIDEVKATVREIDGSDDNEWAHYEEDKLYKSVLKYISNHCTDEHCKQLAVEAMKASEIKFARWYS